MSDTLTLEERLNEELGEAECKIRQLEEKIENKEYTDEWSWRHIRQLSEEENMDLPIPRMEIRYRVDDYNAYADYGLVTRHFMKHIDFTPLSSTRMGIKSAESLNLPHREGAHIIHDKENLKLPGYVVYKDKFKEIPYTSPHERSSDF